MPLTNHGGSLLVFPWCEAPTNNARVFVEQCHVSKCSTLHSAELADVYLVSDRASILKKSVTP